MHTKIDKYTCIHCNQHIHYMRHVRCIHQKAATYRYTWAHENKHLHRYIDISSCMLVFPNTDFCTGISRSFELRVFTKPSLLARSFFRFLS